MKLKFTWPKSSMFFYCYFFCIRLLIFHGVSISGVIYHVGKLHAFLTVQCNIWCPMCQVAANATSNWNLSVASATDKNPNLFHNLFVPNTYFHSIKAKLGTTQLKLFTAKSCSAYFSGALRQCAAPNNVDCTKNSHTSHTSHFLTFCYTSYKYHTLTNLALLTNVTLLTNTTFIKNLQLFIHLTHVIYLTSLTLLPLLPFSKHRPSGTMLSISWNVRLSVRLLVSVFTFEVPFKRLFVPTSQSFYVQYF